MLGPLGVAAPASRKALGAFYTPLPMAAKMVEWAMRTTTDRVLDPSFGGLVFLEAASQRLRELGATPALARTRLYGADLDSEACDAAITSRIAAPSALVQGDFLALNPGAELPEVEAVIGNPPYVRYQLHNGSSASGRRVALAAGLNLTRLASSWAPFVIHSANFVAPGGRLALVLPAELMHAQYAGEVLSWVQRRFARTGLVLFEERVFPGALEEVVLLFADGKDEGTSPRAEIIECQTLEDFEIEVLEARLQAPTSGRPRRGKLLAQLLPDATRELHDRLVDDERTSSLGALASVDIGVVTGANDFFLLPDVEARLLSPKLLRRAISKAVHVTGARVGAADLERLRLDGARVHMLAAARTTPPDVLTTAREHLDRGEAEGIHQRYKCRVREPWYVLPLPGGGTPPDLFLTYCSAEFPRLAVNAAEALHTNTVHGVRVRPTAELDPGALAFAFYNSLTLLSAELVGRSYGGGVLKLEPTEAEALTIPPVSSVGEAELRELDGLLRARRLDAALNLVDEIVLVDGLGLARADVESLRAGAEKLRGRRRARGRPPR